MDVLLEPLHGTRARVVIVVHAKSIHLPDHFVSPKMPTSVCFLFNSIEMSEISTIFIFSVKDIAGLGKLII